jgi:hypothetical protein
VHGETGREDPAEYLLGALAGVVEQEKEKKRVKVKR